MKPVFQTIAGDPTTICFQACLASILEIPMERVPRYGAANQLSLYRAWLEHLGLDLVIANFADRPELAPHTFSIRCGRGLQGGSHAVVAHRGRVVHDPMSGRDPYLKECHCDMVIVPREPQRWPALAELRPST